VDPLDVVGIGNALVDVLVETDATIVESCGLVKGSMQLMSLADAERVHAAAGAGQEQSGGSAANTMAGLSMLGARAGFIGRLASDRLGDTFVSDLEAIGVSLGSRGLVPASDGAGTGRSLILVTPDADRTMCTSLGVAADLDPDNVDEALVESASVTYLEGYLFDLPPAKAAFRHASAVAHRSGGQVAMSLSDPFCVERHRDDFRDLVDRDVDLLFANHEEVCALTGEADVETACGRLRRPGLTLAVTLGAKGALVFDGTDGAPIRVPAVPVERVVDTTGAGDLYAAGFLWGYTRGYALERCTRLGGIAAAEIISHVGARPLADLAALTAGA
jgi:sugar/nucleoside kinase (ribokinase family)